MKNKLLIILLLSISILAACGNNQSKDDTIRIGVSPVPQKKIVEFIKDDLEKEGIKLEIIEFTDYIKPNMGLADNELDANYFQHEPYLNEFNEEKNLDLVSIGGIHIEPMALYSNKIDKIEDLKEGSEIAIPNDSTNGGRALLLLEKNGLIKLDSEAAVLATPNDIIENPKNLKIIELEASTLPRILDDVDGAVINGNFALQADLIPTKDSIIIEESDSPYVNVIAIRKGEEDQERFIKLMKVLQSDKVKKFIEENYNGGVLPAF